MNTAPDSARFGFTLVELLIVVSIITIITGAIIPSFNTYIDNQNTKQAQEQIEDDLRTVQNKALNGENATVLLGPSNNEEVNYWGVEFTEDSATYTSFVSVDLTTCAGGNKRQNDRTYSLVSGDNVLRSDGCVFFSFSNGDIDYSQLDTSTEVIVGPLGGNSTSCRTVQINSSGLIHGLEDTQNSCT